MHCRICDCTQARACPEGCWWVEVDLCSACAARIEAVGATKPQSDVLVKQAQLLKEISGPACTLRYQLASRLTLLHLEHHVQDHQERLRQAREVWRHHQDQLRSVGHDEIALILAHLFVTTTESKRGER